MNRVIQFIAACCFSLVAFSANPSFQSFNTTQFDVTGNRVALTNGVMVTNIVIFGTTTNLLEVWNESNELKFYIDTNGFTFPSLWSSVSGTITGNSTVANGASALGFSLNSSNTLSTSGASLFALKNNSTNLFDVNRLGGITLGRHTDANLVYPGVTGKSFTDLDTVGRNGLDFSAYTTTGAIQGGYFYALQNASLPNSVVTVGAYDVDSYSEWNLTSDPNGRSVFKLETLSGFPFVFEPGDAASETPYTLGTDVTHTSGNLVEVKNNFTNVFTIDYLGNITGRSITVSGANSFLSVSNVTATGTSALNSFTSTSGSVSNGFTVLGASTLNTFTANSGVISNANGLTIGGNIAATYAGITNVMTWALSDMTTALTTGTNKNYWYAPAAGMTIKFVRATLATASSSGTPTFDINEAGVSILSTKITIDANEWDSATAATPPVISDSAIAANAKVDFDIDVAGTAAAGAQVQIGFTVP